MLLLFLSELILAQDIVMGKGSLVKTCKGQFFDSGGAKGNYSVGENSTMTICSDGSSSLSHISLSFSGLDLSQGDKLCFYDGPNTQSKLIVCNDNLPKVFIVQASAANSSGCITIDFKSTNSKASTGWAASVQCVPSCQRIEAEITNTTPKEIPIDTGWIDICPYETVQFEGNAIFPQNGVKYNQSVQNSIFEWNFGDGNNQLGKNTQHTYTKSGGFIATLIVKDQLGCKSTNYIRKKIRVASAPTFNGKAPSQNYCIGDTIRLKANLNSYNKNANLNVIPNPLIFNPSGIRSDSLALPDGDGTSYKTSIRFSDFAPGSTLTNISDLLRIGVNMEHSWMRDLQISIECPNGQTAVLHNYQGRIGKKIVIGQPIETDTIIPKPGKGFDYYWKYNAINDPWLQWANNNPSKSVLPSGDYRPYESFSKLIGCPLNGDWSIIVQDLWSKDNGFIFNWSIDFNPSLLPNNESYLSSILDSKWESNKSTIYTSKDSLLAIAKEAGSQSYKFVVFDEFGCTYDTTLSINILSPTNPLCKSCTSNNLMQNEYTICKGEILNLNAAVNSGILSVPFSATPNYKFGFSNHPPSIPYISELPISNLFPLTITDITKDIKSVCLDIATDYVSDLQIFLESPDGKILELTTNNGGNGKNYENTCFTPKATNSIKNGIAPFNSEYLPEGNWADLNNSSINGKWKLKVSDAFGAGIYGTLNSWNITFNTQNQYKYSWNPPSEISCTSCSNPNVNPTKSTKYVVSISDVYGCNFLDTVKVNVFDKIPAPILSLDTTKIQGTICVKWLPIPGISQYEVNINNTGWVIANGILKHTLNNLQFGKILDIQVRAKDSYCEALPALIQTKYEYCPINIVLDSIALPKCFNTNDACIYVHTKNDFGLVDYTINGNKSNFGFFKNISAGIYQVIATDKLLCSDTLMVDIPRIDSIKIDLQIDSIRCFGQKGAIFVQKSGGSGTLNILWNTTPPTSNTAIANLQKGIYTLTATDSKGCTVVNSVTLNEPPKLNLSASTTNTKCFGSNDGAINLNVSGGTPNYQYFWEDKSKLPSLSNLVAGSYKVSVVDSKYCLDSLKIDINEPPKISANLSNAINYVAKPNQML
ncbi:MAG: proprotein convertase P-domain-containing protein [Saprospiraceae bacterium]|nr:proprotein convertase P-domain-containing protein [Saprospiraceae bacterium]